MAFTRHCPVIFHRGSSAAIRHRRSIVSFLRKKLPNRLVEERMGFRQRPILPGRVQPSTFGTEGLNFCVRDGNRWDPFVIVTGNCELVSRLCLDLRASPLKILSTQSELSKDVCCGGFAVAPTPLRIVPDAFASLCRGLCGRLLHPFASPLMNGLLTIR